MKTRNIITILVCPENSDNIGAAARAIKNMGFSQLRLVRPPRHWQVKGKKMAMSAFDVLKKAKVFPSLQAASADLQKMVATTRRASLGRGRFIDFGEAASKVRHESKKIKIGLVFGCESKGLANKEIRLCDHLITIPAGKTYPSLNLAQAVMVVLFSVAFDRNLKTGPGTVNQGLLDKKAIGITLEYFESALRALGYREGGAELLPRILQTVRDLIKRSGLLEKEVPVWPEDRPVHAPQHSSGLASCLRRLARSRVYHRLQADSV